MANSGPNSNGSQVDGDDQQIHKIYWLSKERGRTFLFVWCSEHDSRVSLASPLY